ncbi:DUF6602 domain-containing protein [Phenylobacterium sp. J367]|uniref:DUF6602 domain-containing protein n=1 Tax=Phenylobacterium sp. J367 TaxID=2898435 RepID=UPI0027E3B029|nr:DUF6602 domain-containing protein [Phenylobacterium sp. J367]
MHEKVHAELELARRAYAHPTTKGDASEDVWLHLFNTYLPRRYRAAKAFIADSNNEFSLQLDVVIFDELYTPPVFAMGAVTIIPAESVYAVFEAKQTANADNLRQAHEKAASVRRLHRTSAPFINGSAQTPGKVPQPILAGLLTLESDWKPEFGEPLKNLLLAAGADSSLDMGCFASNGFFVRDGDAILINDKSTAATAFLFELIARLQALGTVPALDARAYARWLT